MFKYSLDNKRYHTLNYHLKKKYGKKTFKVSLNANFSCPNKVNGNGCIFCTKLGSGDFAGNKDKDLITQFNEVKTIMEHKWPDSYYIGYFQANTNTYAPLNILKEKYETILNIPNVIGLDIATRSDAITDETLDYLNELNKRTNLTIELGLQSMHENTLKLINRGHNLKNFENMVKELQKRNIEVVVHIINGLPGETKNDMIATAKYLNRLHIDGIKIHMLYIVENTELYDMYNAKPFHLLTKEEYIDIVINQLEVLDEKIVIHRITGDPKKEDLLEPKWLLKKFCVLNDIDKEMVKRNTYQGIKAE
ncbi:MAG: TIGR01212 family radical SAM protein [Bacilli bacterium]